MMKDQNVKYQLDFYTLATKKSGSKINDFTMLHSKS